MSRVEADLKAFWVGNAADDRSDLFKTCSDACPLACSGFERDPHFQSGVLGVQSVEIPHHAGDAGIHASTKMGAGVEDKRADTKLLASEHFVGE